MAKRRHDLRQLAGTIALAALVACTPTPTTPGTGAPPRPPKPTATNAPASTTPVTPAGSLAPGASPAPIVAPLTPLSPAPSGQPAALAVLAGQVKAPAALVTAAGGIISDKGLGILSNNGSGLLANNGSNIIANNGGGLVSNNGGGLTSKTKYALAQAAEQLPLVGVPVTLVDAAGQAVLGADGKPVMAVTDEAGRYAFAGVRPGQHLVVRAELPKVGALSRIVAPSVADAPLDLASTLATTYILDKFVATQADKAATLARLPADVEAETVLIAGQAAAKDAPPVTLANAELVARVDALRATDTTLDAQLEKVKKLLIVAGVSNLGDGEVATEVTLRPFRTIWPLADGRVYLQVAEDGMLWRLDPDGRLRAVAGRAATGPGAAVSVGAAPLAVDAQGRLLGGGAAKGVWRLTPGATPADLKVEALAPDLVDVTAVCPLEGDAVLAFTWTPRGAAAAWRIEPGAAPKAIVTQPGPGVPELAGVKRVARLADGTIRLLLTPMMVPYVSRFDVATGALTKVFEWKSGLLDVAMGVDGAVYYTKPDDQAVYAGTAGPDGADPAVPDLARPDVWLQNPFALAPGGGAYFMAGGFHLSTKNATLNLRKGGAATHLAGLTAEASASGPGVVSLTAPTAFAVDGEGDLLVADNGVLVRVKPGGAPAPVVPAGLGIEGATFKARYPFVAADGAVWVVGQESNAESFIKARDAVFRVAPDGAVTVLYRANGGIGYAEQGPDGALLLGDTKMASLSDITGSVVRIAPDGTPTDLVAASAAAASTKVWYDAGRPVYAKPRYEGDQVFYAPVRIEPDGTTTQLPEVKGAPPFTDAAGRTYALGKAVTRTDPKTGEQVVLAGPGGRTFAGSGVDDGVGEAKALAFGPAGDLFFLDGPNRQIKRIPVDKL